VLQPSYPCTPVPVAARNAKGNSLTWKHGCNDSGSEVFYRPGGGTAGGENKEERNGLLGDGGYNDEIGRPPDGG